MKLYLDLYGINDEDTLYCVTGEPLKLNENGIVSMLDQVGDELELPKIVFHPAGIPFAPPGGPGYSASVFNPPVTTLGFCIPAFLAYASFSLK